MTEKRAHSKIWLAGLLAVVVTPAAMGAATTMTPAILQRWGISAETHAAMSDSRRQEMEAQVLDLETTRLAEVETLKSLVGERWKDFVDAQEIPTEAGRKLLEGGKAQPPAPLASLRPAHGLTAELPRMLSGETAPIAPSREKSSSFFDGATSLVAGAGTVGVDVVAGAHVINAYAMGDAAIALGNTAKSLGEQAAAAGAAGDMAGAQALGAQAEQTGAQAEAQGAKAVKAAKTARTLTAIGGGLAVADGLWDVYKGVTQKRRSVEDLKTAQSVLAEEKGPTVYAAAALQAAERFKGMVDRAKERTVVGGVKIGAGALQLASLGVAVTVAPYLLVAGAAIYMGAVLYQYRREIAGAFVDVYQWGLRQTGLSGNRPNPDVSPKIESARDADLGMQG